MIHFLSQGPLGLRILRKGEDLIEGAKANALLQTGRDFFPAHDSLLDRYACWDLRPGADKAQKALARIGQSCALAAFAWNGREPLAMAWINSIGTHSGELHFLPRVREPRACVCAARLFLKAAGQSFKSLICLIPQPFYGAHRLARTLGFRPLANLRGACRLASRGGMCRDGRLYLWEAD